MNSPGSPLLHPRFISWFLCLLISMRVSAAETVVHRFAGSPADGANPASGMISDSTGNLYGTTSAGGAFGAGTVYKLSYSSSSGLYTETVLYSFTGGSDGGTPVASLVFDTAGNLYGTTKFGGTGTCSSMANGCGVVFILTQASGYHTETVLYSFMGNSDGGLPLASLAIDANGNLFGTASCGGSSPCSGGNGLVFELMASNPFVETVLFPFMGGATGATPTAAVILDGSGNLLGTTEFGGGGPCSANGCGLVFKLVKSSGYSEMMLHPFTGGSDGGLPVAPLVADTSGNVYGAASCGGTAPCMSGGGNGVVYEISSSGTFTPLHKFSISGTVGAKPKAGLAFDSTFANLYGTTFQGGANGLGVVFKIQLAGAIYTNLHSYAGAATGDGANPLSAVSYIAPGHFDPNPLRVRCPKGCALETTFAGGTVANQGVISSITPAAYTYIPINVSAK